MAILYGVARSTSGVVVPTPTVTVYDSGTTDVSTIYSDSALTTAESNPFTGATDGTYTCYVPAGLYDVKVVKSGYLDETTPNFAISGPDAVQAKPLFISTDLTSTTTVFGIYEFSVLKPGSTYFGFQVLNIWWLDDDDTTATNLQLRIKCYNATDTLQWTVTATQTAIPHPRTSFAYPDSDGVTAAAAQVSDLNALIATELGGRVMTTGDQVTLENIVTCPDITLGVQFLIIEY